MLNLDDSKDIYNKNKFFSWADSFMESTGSHGVFKEIVSCRLEMILDGMKIECASNNLYQLITSDKGRAVNGIVPFFNLPDEYLLFEKNAIAIFGNILVCWAEFELYKVHKNIKTYSVGPRNRKPSIDCTVELYESEIIQDIENDDRLFMTYYSDMAMYLSDAILVITLETLVKEQCWYEILFRLRLSCSGRHFVLHADCNMAYPIIISTALIQSWSKRKGWLTFDSFFQADDWVLSLSQGDLSQLYSMGLFCTDSQSIITGKSVKAFESELNDNLINPNKVCEIIRLTVSGIPEKRHKYLFLGQKKLMEKLVEAGVRLAFTIIEQKSMLSFYRAMNKQNPENAVYITTSYNYISGVRSEKGFWLTESLSKKLNDCSFRYYIKKNFQ